MSNRLRHSETGFTLLELLIVSLLLSLMSIILYSSLQGIMQTRSVLEDKVRVTAEARSVLLRLITELGSRAPQPVRSRPVSPDGIGQYSRNSPYMLGFHIREGDTDKDILRFVSRGKAQAAYGARANYGDVQIEYRLEDPEGLRTFGDEQTSILVREESPASVIDEDIVRARRVVFPLLENVVSLRFRFRGASAKEWENEWQGKTRRLPQAIEISLALRANDGTIHAFRTAIAIEEPTRTESGFSPTGSP